MIITNIDQVNQIMTDMFQAFQLLPPDAREFIYQKLTDDLTQLNNTSLYTYQVFQSYYFRVLSCGVNVEQASILELGAGKPLGTGIFWNFAGARKYTAIDRYNPVNLDELWLTRFQHIITMNMYNPQGFNLEALIKFKPDNTYTIDADRIALIQGVFEEYPFAPGSFDLIYSHAALEHFADMERQIDKMYQILSPGGTMIHQIDLRQHNTDRVQVPDVNTSVEFLRYSPTEWAELYPAGSYHYVNRLRASDYESLFTRKGFTILESLTNGRMELDDTVYSRIHPCFHGYSVEDLARTGILLILRKKA